MATKFRCVIKTRYGYYANNGTTNNSVSRACIFVGSPTALPVYTELKQGGMEPYIHIIGTTEGAPQ